MTLSWGLLCIYSDDNGVVTHRRIQDFVGGGGKAPSPGSAPDYCAAVNYLATQIHICEGFGGGGEVGQGPLIAPPPPLDPRSNG